jgi:hypothetical protein
MARYVFGIGLLLLASSPMFADSMYVVSMDTSTLPPGAGPYQLYLNLIDGNGIGDANNTVTLNTFACIGASLAGCPSGAYSLTDSIFSVSTTFPFGAGGEVAFKVALTGNLDANLVPDSFQLSILDGNNSPLPTTDPSGSDAVLFAQFDQANPILQGYGSPAGAATTFSAPLIEPVPEPRLLPPLSLALCLILFLRKRQRPPETGATASITEI